jgi:hypothetical protein
MTAEPGDLERLRGMSGGVDRTMVPASSDGRGKPRLVTGTAMIWFGIGLPLFFLLLRLCGVLTEPFVVEFFAGIGVILCGVGWNINRERRTRRA